MKLSSLNPLVSWKATNTHRVNIGGDALKVNLERPSFAGRIVQFLMPGTYRAHRLQCLQNFMTQIHERYAGVGADKVLKKEFGGASVQEMKSRGVKIKRLTRDHVDRVRARLSYLVIEAANKQTAAAPKETAPKESAKPAWMPEGTYPRAQKKELAQKMYGYVDFLSKNQEQIPQDIRAEAEARMAEGTSFLAAVMPLLMRKHVPGIEKPNIDKSSTPPPASTFALNLPEGTPPNKTRSAQWSPDAQPPGSKFYHEEQEPGTGLCSMHALNAFVGAPVKTPESFRQSVAEQFLEMGFAETMHDARSLIDGADPAALPSVLHKLAKEGTIDARASEARLESFPINAQNKEAVAARLDAFEGDRLILGYPGTPTSDAHLVALRRDSAHNWTLINSLHLTQEPLKESLGAYITGKYNHVHLVHMEPDAPTHNIS